MPEALDHYVAVWWQAVHDLVRVLEDLTPGEWAEPTDLPGWDVADIAAHAAHLESLLAGRPHDEVEVGRPDHVRGSLGVLTEQGVVARRGTEPDALIGELLASATARHTRLLDDPPTDPSAPAPGVFGDFGWTVGQLLRNRPLDLWFHEQDVRRAVGRPGNLDGPAAIHAADYLTEAMGFVLAKRAQAPVGTTLVLAVAGHAPAAFAVGDDGRGRPLAEVPQDPTVRIAADRETFLLLAGGRRAPDSGAVSVDGDAALGEAVLAAMAVVP